MNDLISLFKNDLFQLIKELKDKKIINDFNKKNISIDYSSKSKQGDLSTNVFLLLNKVHHNTNFDLKEIIIKYLSNIEYIENVNLAKAGFINIFIKKKFLFLKLKNFLVDSEIKNNVTVDKKKINLEFVSANPTGPIHVAHMRGAILGDVLASILENIGHDVTREYYVNDAGSQIFNLGNSLFKRYQQLFNLNIQLIDSEYPGTYLIPIANEIKKLNGNKWLKFQNIKERESYFNTFAVNSLIKNIKDDLLLIDINFDKFTFESKIIKDKIIDKVFYLLEDKNLIYEGFLEKPLGDDKNWKPRKQLLFKSTNFNDDLDRAFKKSNGEWTYFANDASYHYDKYMRGFDKLINIWGADHIGYINRMKSIVDVISNKKNYLDVFICQIVRLIKDKKYLKMSKRDDNFITLKEMYHHVGKDALRYFMISTKSETPMDFNMNKVIEKNKENPVFYCQYAYARSSSVINKSKEYKKIPNVLDSFDLFDISTISEYEWEIILKILSWPYVLLQSAESMQPHRITNYLEDLCSHFHSFWNRGKDDNSLRMIDENDIGKTMSKLIWVYFFKVTLKKIFTIIGISAPESM